MTTPVDTLANTSDDGRGQPGRRAVLGLAGAATAAAVLAQARPAAADDAPLRSRSAAQSVLRTGAASPADLPSDEAFTRHLLLRTTYGLSPALMADVAAAGSTQAWLDGQLDPAGIDDSACDRIVTRFPLAHAGPPELYAKLKVGAWNGLQDLQGMTVARNVWSRRQLFEVMTEFWSNHLNITVPSSDVWASKGWDDQYVVRANALGTFSDLLVASVTSPAMLQYLDNARSKGSAPNENYGREVLELHTVGRGAGYTQDDVVAAARAFTGLTTWGTFAGGTPATYGTFRYNPAWRYVGPLRVLGWSSPNLDPAGGVEVARSLMRYLAVHPATAARIAYKLAVRFVSDNPPQELVDRLAQVYLDGGTAVVPVLRALFASPEFAASAGQKYRRPWEDTVATMRILGIEASPDTQTQDFTTLLFYASQMGSAPMGWHPPDGYPDVAAAWAGTGVVLGRWNIHTALAATFFKQGGFAYPGSSLFARLLPGPVPASRTLLVTALAARLLPGVALPDAHRDALVAFLGGPGPVRPTADLAGLFPILVSVLLSSPLWSVR